MSKRKPLRVIYVGSPELFSKGASAVHVMKMCQAMGRLGVDTELLLSSNHGDEELRRYYGVEDNFQITKLPYFRNTTLRNIVHGVLASFHARARRRDFDLVVTRNIVFAYLATVFFKIPTVYDAHHPLVKGARRLFDSFKDSKYLVRFSTNSEGLADIYLSLGLPQEKLVVAHNGVDLEDYKSLPGTNEARAELGLASERKIVCYSGNIYEGRGIDQLIECAKELKDVLFLIVGGLDEDVNRIRALAESKNAENIMLTGFVPQKRVAMYLASADALVLPYTLETTIKGGTKAKDFTSPIKLFEYMASGRPIVASAIPSVTEVLENGRNSLLVKPGDAESLSLGIQKVLDDHLLSETITKGALTDVKNYSWEGRAKKLLALGEEVSAVKRYPQE